MPELPEVETVLRTLEDRLQQFVIKDVNVLYPRMIDTHTPEQFRKKICNQQVLAYHRLGKYMIFELTSYYLVAHMRMEGKFYIKSAVEDIDKHTHVIFDINDKQLRYHDTRKFGRMGLYEKDVEYHQLPVFKNVGYDAFDACVDAEYIYKSAKKRNISLKQFLLDQKVVAGIGNIYADEICFSCKLHPASRVHRISKKDSEQIVYHMRRILQGAIKAGGTTIRSYTSQFKVDGRFQLQLKVHGRKEKACPVCGMAIEKIQHHTRGTYFCRVCQKRK